ncbi:MAG: 16S rRNA (uracil(1498)-N(3))-methyltransferase [Candidatus Thioglobus sp.]|nr:16S rRNA (uracil(1498)-N(3))-methyltransferase [Candidatus Thioglobus sp.]
MKSPRLHQNIALKIDDEIALDRCGSHYLAKVLRFPQGQNIILFNGNGSNYTAKVLDCKKHIRVKILSKSPDLVESKLNLTLVQGIAKGEKMDFLLQKAVELGVNKIVPIVSKRCVVRLDADKSQKRQAHWQKIIISACEQSERCVLPEILPIMALEQWLQQPVENGFVLHQRAEKTLLELDFIAKATILIGPEGGLSEAEISNAVAANYQPLLLGKRVLRTETASLAAIANMQLLWGS